MVLYVIERFFFWGGKIWSEGLSDIDTTVNDWLGKMFCRVSGQRRRLLGDTILLDQILPEELGRECLGVFDGKQSDFNENLA